MSYRRYRTESYHSHDCSHVFKILHRIKVDIAHTCVHEDEPIHSDADVEHLIEETDELIEDVKEVWDEICVLAPIYGHDIYHKFDRIFDEMCHTLDDLHERLRKELCCMPGATPMPAPGPVSPALPVTLPIRHQHIKELLHHACRKLHEEYRRLCEEACRAHLISAESKSSLALY